MPPPSPYNQLPPLETMQQGYYPAPPMQQTTIAPRQGYYYPIPSFQAPSQYDPPPSNQQQAPTELLSSQPIEEQRRWPARTSAYTGHTSFETRAQFHHY